MKARVLKAFRDKSDFSKVYDQGSVLDLPPERVRYLKELGLVEELRERTRSHTKEQ